MKTGRAFATIARLYGVKRRWFGLEPDFLFKRRLLKVMQTPSIRNVGR